MSTTTFQTLADVVLFVHFTVVLFVIAGLVYIIIGNLRTWRMANAFWFRLAHLSAIAVVVMQAWLGEICPLTVLEMWLRKQAQETTYTGSFIEHWLQQLLYYEAPSWVFTLIYTLFGLVVLIAWWYFPPHRKSRYSKKDQLP